MSQYGKKSNEELEASSRCSYINLFIPKYLNYDFSTTPVTAAFESSQYLGCNEAVHEDRIVRKFPIIFRDNGEPWDLGNLYLIWKFNEMSKLDTPNIGTLTSIARHLTMYLRFIEHYRLNGSPINEFYFPENASERITYRYHRYLRQLLRKNPQPIGLNVAKARMNAVVNFYRGLIKWKLVSESEIENQPYEERVAGIPITNHVGITRIQEIETTDLSFKAHHRDTEIGFIKDGAKLRPLKDSEQKIIFDALDEYQNRTFQLMCWVALFTGARKQTVCTIRIKDIKKIIGKRANAQNELLLQVGLGTDTDIKFQSRYGKGYRLHIPVELIQLLTEYSNSPEAEDRRKKSFYGNSDDNYVFLASNGSPYYTSQKELADRNNPGFEHILPLQERIDFPIANGQSITNYVSRLNELIQQKHLNFNRFRFHDLRATYGMNFVRDCLKKGIKPDLILTMLKPRMGHNSIDTTLLYLNYDELSEQIDILSEAHFDRLSSLV